MLTEAFDGGTGFSTPAFATEVNISASAFFTGAALSAGGELSAFTAGFTTVSTTLGIFMFMIEREQ